MEASDPLMVMFTLRMSKAILPEDGPPNVALTHLEGCRRVGTKRVESKSKATAGGRRNGGRAYGKYAGYDNPPEVGYADPDGTEVVDDWLCVESCPVRELGEMSGELTSGKPLGRLHTDNGGRNTYGNYTGYQYQHIGIGDKGTAARFYPQSDWQYEIEERLAGVTPFRYQAKAGRKERDAGLEGMPAEYQKQTVAPNRLKCQKCGGWQNVGSAATDNRPNSTCNCIAPDYQEMHLRANPVRNPHPTVKPIELTKWLATLLLPPPEYAPRRILVPFSGSGSEMIGAMLAGWDEVTGIEMEGEYTEIAVARCSFWESKMKELGSDDTKTILKSCSK